MSKTREAEAAWTPPPVEPPKYNIVKKMLRLSFSFLLILEFGVGSLCEELCFQGFSMFLLELCPRAHIQVSQKRLNCLPSLRGRRSRSHSHSTSTSTSSTFSTRPGAGISSPGLRSHRGEDALRVHAVDDAPTEAVVGEERGAHFRTS